MAERWTRAIQLLCLTLLLSGCYSTPSEQKAAAMEAERREYCNELIDKMDRLENRPLRRSELQRRYDEECTDDRSFPENPED